MSGGLESYNNVNVNSTDYLVEGTEAVSLGKEKAFWEIQ